MKESSGWEQQTMLTASMHKIRQVAVAVSWGAVPCSPWYHNQWTFNVCLIEKKQQHTSAFVWTGIGKKSYLLTVQNEQFETIQFLLDPPANNNKILFPLDFQENNLNIIRTTFCTSPKLFHFDSTETHWHRPLKPRVLIIGVGKKTQPSANADTVTLLWFHTGLTSGKMFTLVDLHTNTSSHLHIFKVATEQGWIMFCFGQTVDKVDHSW